MNPAARNSIACKLQRSLLGTGSYEVASLLITSPGSKTSPANKSI